ncbi:uncharacterized protein LY79DRAFT_284467 [Colletotrichum navitas]|uniref:Uncharacterized protein n=1 Tax=Colletotrichum navitas TaxID=681940 RepID=A0AAD8V9R3_9PEZI|nr:uncharacterized protein LY79DRAFT_284467 [Colletotrichum navitas]KAK1598264.1 hypothetical protein LY79DRAFT_284467 [Colletotrichum navitas]
MGLLGALMDWSEHICYCWDVRCACLRSPFHTLPPHKAESTVLSPRNDTTCQAGTFAAEDPHHQHRRHVG